MIGIQPANFSKRLLWGTFFCALLFTLSTPLYSIPLIGGRRFLTQLAFPVSIISFLLLSLSFYSKKDIAFFLNCFVKNFLYIILPFVPFIFGLLITLLIYSPDKGQFVFKPSTIISYIIFLSFIFATLKSPCEIKFQKGWLWIISSIAIWITLLLLCTICFEKSKSFFELRDFVRPWVTVFSRCTSLVSGICLFGFIYSQTRLKKIYYASTGIIGFILAAVVLQTRSVLLSPLLAACLLLLYFFKEQKNNLKPIAITTCIFIIVSSLSIMFLSERVVKGTSELASSGNFSEIQEVINKVETDTPLTNTESQIFSSLNTSMGGRMAAWSTVTKISKEHFFWGTGEGRLDHFIDVQKLFKSSGNFVVHFHSDFFQVFVVGGFFLLLCMVLTQFLLFFRAVQNKNWLQIFLILSMFTFGLGEFSLIDAQTMLVFISAWIISSLLFDPQKKPKGCQKLQSI